MGTLFVDKLDPQSGTALEIGSSGDTMTVPSGATFNVAGTLQSGGAAVSNAPAFLVYKTSNQELSDNAFTNDVMLVKKDGVSTLTGMSGVPQAVVDPATGEPYRFKTGDDYKEDQLKILNDLMKQLGYVKKVSDTNILP